MTAFFTEGRFEDAGEAMAGVTSFFAGKAPLNDSADASSSTAAAPGVDRGRENRSLIMMAAPARASGSFVPLWTEPIFLQQFAAEVGDQKEFRVGHNVARTPCLDDETLTCSKVARYRMFRDDQAASRRRARATSRVSCALYADVLDGMASETASGDDHINDITPAPRDYSPSERTALRKLAAELRTATEFEARHDAICLAQEQHCSRREHRLTLALAARLGKKLQSLPPSQQFILFGPRELPSLVFAVERLPASMASARGEYAIVVTNAGGPGLEYHPNDARGRSVPVVYVSGIPEEKMLSAATLWFLVRSVPLPGDRVERESKGPWDS